ncbi:MAG: hypothetical protein J0I82_02670 [Spirosoma sp.]|uniref:hypothetical protein n=1 Tax=unclassified Spirosoma TaxID=2621999 RepID=UPI001AC32F48|nr:MULTISPECIES: hypothetical protein [unclassified Spirosoma]MBN8820900.1 hypothetical protein [Spirosoma sp.]
MKNKSWLSFVPAYWAALFDIIITITHQSDDYWQGNLTKANEGNPFGAYMMAHHVSGIFVICFIWLVIIGLVGRWLPNNYTKVFLLFVLIVHSWGASTWLSQFYGFWSVIGFTLFNAILFYRVEDFRQSQVVKAP